jgi:L-seryl-tRNA(Ser) seleniumtransferase
LLADCQDIADGLSDVAGLSVTGVDATEGRGPGVHVKVQSSEPGATARDLVKRLQDGEPSVHANHSRLREGIVVFGATCLKPGDTAIVVRRVRAELGYEHGPTQL